MSYLKAQAAGVAEHALERQSENCCHPSFGKISANILIKMQLLFFDQAQDEQSCGKLGSSTK
jgi:hypothetical protein